MGMSGKELTFEVGNTWHSRFPSPVWKLCDAEDGKCCHGDVFSLVRLDLYLQEGDVSRTCDNALASSCQAYQTKLPFLKALHYKYHVSHY